MARNPSRETHAVLVVGEGGVVRLGKRTREVIDVDAVEDEEMGRKRRRRTESAKEGESNVHGEVIEVTTRRNNPPNSERALQNAMEVAPERMRMAGEIYVGRGSGRDEEGVESASRAEDETQHSTYTVGEEEAANAEDEGEERTEGISDDDGAARSSVRVASGSSFNTGRSCESGQGDSTVVIERVASHFFDNDDDAEEEQQWNELGSVAELELIDAGWDEVRMDATV